MADSLNLKVIAEGVESQVQLSSLNDLGGHYVQGYFYAKPQPIEALQSWVKQHICSYYQNLRQIVRVKKTILFSSLTYGPVSQRYFKCLLTIQSGIVPCVQ